MCRLTVPAELPGPLHGPSKAQAHAYGLSTHLDACALWGVTGCHPKGTVGMLMWQLMGTLSAARCACAQMLHIMDSTAPMCVPVHKNLWHAVIVCCQHSVPAPTAMCNHPTIPCLRILQLPCHKAPLGS